MSIKNQPDNLNLLQLVAFETNFQRIPNVNYFCQKVNIPGMVLGSAVQPTPFSDIPLEGDKLSFDTLDISFLIDELIGFIVVNTKKFGFIIFLVHISLYIIYKI